MPTNHEDLWRKIPGLCFYSIFYKLWLILLTQKSFYVGNLEKIIFNLAVVLIKHQFKNIMYQKLVKKWLINTWIFVCTCPRICLCDSSQIFFTSFWLDSQSGKVRRPTLSSRPNCAEKFHLNCFSIINTFKYPTGPSFSLRIILLIDSCELELHIYNSVCFGTCLSKNWQ